MEQSTKLSACLVTKLSIAERFSEILYLHYTHNTIYSIAPQTMLKILENYAIRRHKTTPRWE